MQIKPEDESEKYLKKKKKGIKYSSFQVYIEVLQSAIISRFDDTCKSLESIGTRVTVLAANYI